VQTLQPIVQPGTALPVEDDPTTDPQQLTGTIQQPCSSGQCAGDAGNSLLVASDVGDGSMDGPVIRFRPIGGIVGANTTVRHRFGRGGGARRPKPRRSTRRGDRQRRYTSQLHQPDVRSFRPAQRVPRRTHRVPQRHDRPSRPLRLVPRLGAGCSTPTAAKPTKPRTRRLRLLEAYDWRFAASDKGSSRDPRLI
jgi:hypothetical protein